MSGVSPEGTRESGASFEPDPETGDPTKYQRGMRKGSTVLPNRRTQELNSKKAFSIDDLPVVEINETVVGHDQWGEPIIETSTSAYMGDMISKVGAAQSPSELSAEKEPCQNPKPTTTSDNTSVSEATTPTPDEPTSKSKTTPTLPPKKPSPAPLPTLPVEKAKPSHSTTAAPTKQAAISSEQTLKVLNEQLNSSLQPIHETINQLSGHVAALQPSKPASSKVSTATRVTVKGAAINMACDAVSITREGSRLFCLFKADGNYLIPPQSDEQAELSGKIVSDTGIETQILSVRPTGVTVPFYIDDQQYIITLFTIVE